MHFIDEAKVFLKSGDGGNGCCSFRKEKYIEFGGPDGGNGGNGGSIIFRVVSNLNTLIDFRYRQHFRAQKGDKGQGCNKTGKSGEDLIINVPQGTQVLSEDKKYVLYDFDKSPYQEIIIKGGRGGMGNANFKTSRNQSPRKFTEGEVGNELCVWLNLKLLSSVGLLGMPNAGKSTFLSKVTSAKPKIADYPFTTLKPQLGVAYHKNNEFTIADIPGLIAGASLGYGLGINFLKHLERCKILLHLIDATSEDIIKSYEIINKELMNYNSIANKPQLILLSKTDLVNTEELERKKMQLKQHIKQDILTYSSVTNLGVSMVKESLVRILNNSP